MAKRPPPINLDQYLEGKSQKYMSYEDGAREYGIPYWTFVKVAKEAESTWALRKTCMVDKTILDKYIEDNNL